MKRESVVRLRLRATPWMLAVLLAPAIACGEETVSPLEGLRREAQAVQPLMRSPLARAFLAGVPGLPSIAPRTLAQDTLRRVWYAPADTAALPDSIRGRLMPRTFEERFYYYTRYGTPLAYARPLEILAGAGLKDVAGLRIADFGYGGIGHLRLLAALGADVTGIEVDALLPLLYAVPGDQGVVQGAGGRAGALRLLHGRYPADSAVAAALGDGYDLFISKNTLKNGYLHPAQKVDPRMLVRLGVDDTTFVHTLASMLRPGGLALIYNLSPAPSPPGEPYKPWADGRSPFPRELWRTAGFEVLAFDRNDDASARAMGHALGWDRGPSPMRLKDDLFALYTLVRKKR